MVTLKDIATRAGVSRATAGLVLGGGEMATRFAAGTRERVLDAARELGYRPNSSARAVSTGRFDCVALLVSDQGYRSAVYSRMLDGIHDALAERDMHLALARESDARMTEDGFLPRVLRRLYADGLLINYNIGVPARLVEMVGEYRVPCVWINAKRDADCVFLDDYAASYAATERLLALGHRRVAFLAYSPSAHYSMADRRDGYRAAMAGAGLEPEVIAPASPEERSRRQWEETMAARLARPDRPTALLAYGPQALRPAYVAALKRGLRVPEDLSLVVFDQSVFDEMGLPMTTVLLPEYRMGRAAVGLLLRKIEAPDDPLPPESLDMEQADGESCAPPPA